MKAKVIENGIEIKKLLSLVATLDILCVKGIVS